MIDLIETSALSAPLKLSAAGLEITELPDRVVHLGTAKALIGLELSLPENGAFWEEHGLRIQWFDHAHYLVMGQVSKTADLTDQSDGWAGVLISGAASRDVLARLCPLDLRDGQFGPGRTARSLIGHMNAVITCIGPDQYEVMVFRSMADTLAHDLERVVGHLSARAG